MELNARIREEFLTKSKNSYAAESREFSENAIDCTDGTNPFGCPREVLDVLDAIKPEEMINYPHNHQAVESICEYWSEISNVSSKNIMLTGGSIGGIYTINNIFSRRNANVLGIAPQFSEYVSHATMIGMNYSFVPLERENNYKFNVSEFLDKITSELTLIYLDNPNNPTGQLIPPDEIEMILAKAYKNNVYVIVDEAYGDFVHHSQSAIQFVNNYENVIVLRTLSKGFGLAGIRAGYMIASPEILHCADQITNPYEVSEISRIIMNTALNNAYRLESDTKSFIKSKNLMREILKGSKIKMAYTNDQVPISMLYHEDPDFNLVDLLAKHELITIAGSEFDTINDSCVRCRLPKPNDLDRFMDLLSIAAHES